MTDRKIVGTPGTQGFDTAARRPLAQCMYDLEARKSLIIFQ